MNRGVRKQEIFRSDSDRRRFLGLLGDIRDRYGVETHSFALMSNHYHLLLHTPLGNLSRAMQHLNGVYTQRFNRIYGLDGSLFRGRFHSIIVKADPYLIEVVRYIHRNPVEAGICSSAEQFSWSSHRSYLAMRRRPHFLRCETILEYFGSDRTRFAEFVAAADTPAATEVTEALNVDGPAIGDLLSARKAVTGLARHSPSAQPRRDLRAPANLAAIERFIAARFGTCRAVRSTHTRGRRDDAQALLLTVSHRSGAATLPELAERYGYATSTSVSSAIRRFEARAANDADLQKLLHEGLSLAHAA